MATATSKAESATVAWGDDKIYRDLAAVAATHYAGTMIAINSSGYAVKCEDGTAGLQFDGLVANSPPIETTTDDTDPRKKVSVQRPFRFTMKIASAAITDIGRAVYALFNNEVAFSGVTNSILVGWVDAFINSTSVTVRPIYAGIRGDSSFDGATLTFAGATGGNTIVMPDNLADALSIVEGANAYLTFTTTNSSESIDVKKTLRFAGTTANNIIALVDNLADALNIKEGSNSFLKFVTTNSSESIVLGKATTGVSLAVTAGLTSSGATGAGIGYTTGAGGAVIQATDRSTGVTLDKLCGAITTATASLAAGAEAEFSVTNSTVAATDTVVVCLKTSSVTGASIPYVSTVAAGSFKITLSNLHSATADTSASVINFSVIKAVAA